VLAHHGQVPVVLQEPMRDDGVGSGPLQVQRSGGGGGGKDGGLVKGGGSGSWLRWLRRGGCGGAAPLTPTEMSCGLPGTPAGTFTGRLPVEGDWFARTESSRSSNIGSEPKLYSASSATSMASPSQACFSRVGPAAQKRTGATASARCYAMP
jgi:hypothetical protein